MKTQNARDKFYMAGTEGTGNYIVLLITALGRIGYRLLGFNEARVRVEPISMEVVEQMSGHFGAGWKKPGQEGQQRWSRMVAGSENLKAALLQGIKALGTSGFCEINPDMPDWAAEMVSNYFAQKHSVEQAEVAESDVVTDDNAVCNEGVTVDNSVGYTAEELMALTKPQLVAMAKACGLKTRKLNKAALVAAILEPESGDDESDDESYSFPSSVNGLDVVDQRIALFMGLSKTILVEKAKILGLKTRKLNKLALVNAIVQAEADESGTEE